MQLFRSLFGKVLRFQKQLNSLQECSRLSCYVRVQKDKALGFLWLDNTGGYVILVLERFGGGGFYLRQVMVFACSTTRMLMDDVDYVFKHYRTKGLPMKGIESRESSRCLDL